MTIELIALHFLHCKRYFEYNNNNLTSNQFLVLLHLLCYFSWSSIFSISILEKKKRRPDDGGTSTDNEQSERERKKKQSRERHFDRDLQQ